MEMRFDAAVDFFFKYEGENCTSDFGLSLFDIACQRGNIHVIDMFLKQKVYINGSTDQQPYPPLHYAVRAMKTDTVKHLLGRGANPDIRESRRNWTVLHWICDDTCDTIFDRTDNKLIMIKILVENNGNVNCRDKYGSSPALLLVKAIDRIRQTTKDRITPQSFLDKIIEFQLKRLKFVLPVNQSALHYIIKNYYQIPEGAKIIGFILKHDQNLIDRNNKNQALQLALDFRYFDVFEVLIKHSARIQLNFDSTLGKPFELNENLNLLCILKLLKEKNIKLSVETYLKLVLYLMEPKIRSITDKINAMEVGLSIVETDLQMIESLDLMKKMYIRIGKFLKVDKYIEFKVKSSTCEFFSQMCEKWGREINVTETTLNFVKNITKDEVESELKYIIKKTQLDFRKCYEIVNYKNFLEKFPICGRAFIAIVVRKLIREFLIYVLGKLSNGSKINNMSNMSNEESRRNQD
ncbi:hypothetical protein TKK_0004881 [Trichogramma kaykai]